MIARRIGSWWITPAIVLALAGCTDIATKVADPGKDAGGSNGVSDMDGGGGRMDAGAVDSGKKPESDAQLPTEKMRPEVVSVPPPYAVAEGKYDYPPKSSEADATEWKVKEGPEGMTSAEGKVNWTPNKTQGGSHHVVVEGKSGKNGEKSATQEYEVVVAVAEKRAEAKATPKDGGQATVNSPKSDIQGASVKAGPGSMQEEKTLTISELDKSPPMSNKSGELKSVEYGPSGQAFSRPALIALPLPSDAVLNAARIGAFVYNPAGRWERVRTVGVDLTRRFVYAEAKHFSLYAGAQSNLDVTVALERMHPSSSCEDKLVGRAELSSPLTDVEASSINNATPPIKALIEGGASNVEAVLSASGFAGSLRFVRVFDLVVGEGANASVIETRLLASTLYAPGDGTAVVRHTRATGDVLAEFSFDNIGENLATISTHLRGAPTHALFNSITTDPVAMAMRMHVVYSEQDTSLDPVSVDDLGIATVDVAALAPAEPRGAINFDGDCDRLANTYDQIDNRELASLVVSPEDVATMFVGGSVRLTAVPENLSKPEDLSFSLIAGSGTLSNVDDDANAREFTSEEAGRKQIEVSAPGNELSYVFVVDVLPVPAVNTAPSCVPSAGSLVSKVGEAAGLSAVALDTESPESALTIEWGLVDDSGDVPVLIENGQLDSFGKTARLNPATAGEYRVGCRAFDGTDYGPVGEVLLSVVAADENRLPTDTFLSPPSATILVGESLTLSAQGTDPDGDDLVFSWTSSAGTLGSATSDTTSSSVTLTSAEEALITVTVSISDGEGPATELSTKVLVITNETQLEAPDADSDGFPAGEGAAFDCDDSKANVFPTAVDICGNDIDEDCADGPRKNDCDDDGFTIEQGDCNDFDANVNPEGVELCNGIDDDCTRGVDDPFFKALGSSCSVGTGACESTGNNVCSADGLSVVCSSQPGPSSAETCNGIDDDCDGEIDDDVSCGAPDGGVGDGGVGDGGGGGPNLSLQGVWWQCLSSSCSELDGKGFNFLARGTVDFLDHNGQGIYDPSKGPYCVEGPGGYSIEGNVISFLVQENEGPTTYTGTLEIVGDQASVTWIQGPNELEPVMYLKSIIAADGGACDDGGPQCMPQETCQNGFDDDCDGCPDANEVECGGQGCATTCSCNIQPGICDGKCPCDPDCGQCAPQEDCNAAGNQDCDPYSTDSEDPDCQISCAQNPNQPGCDDPGETCLTAVNISTGGTFQGAIGGFNDVTTTCSGNATLDSVYWFNVGAGGVNLTLGITSSSPNVSLALLEAPADWDPAMGCPATMGPNPCIFGNSNAFKGYVPGGRYVVVVEGPPGTSYSLRLGKLFNGTCNPPSGATANVDGDDFTLCNDDCDDANAQIYPGATELCNGVDDNCNGIIDDMDGACSTGLLGACSVGRMDCKAGCQPTQIASATDYCGDDTDNDCDGSVDELDCVTDAGETCSNAIPVGAGGTFSGSIENANNDAVSGCGFNSPEIFYAFNVPSATTEVLFGMKPQPGQAARYTLYRDCQLVPVDCFVDGSRYLTPGNYLLAVESDGSQNDPNYTFSIAFREQGECLTPDLDEDGFDLCNGDCNESASNVYMGAAEGDACDGLDNNCNGLVDDLTVQCPVPNAQGACADGRVVCGAGGTSCMQVNQPDALGRDFCGDGVDNDCDGAADTEDLQTCVTVPQGDVCSLAMDVGDGGTFGDTLNGYGDDSDAGCGDGTGLGGGIDRFYSLTITETRRVRIELPHTEQPLSLSLLGSCSNQAQAAECTGNIADRVLTAGTYIFAVSSKSPLDYVLRVFSQAQFDETGSTCSPADSDEDGFTMCNGDCLEGESTSYMGAPELCGDGIDNNCNYIVDEVGESCFVEGGTCGNGRTSCSEVTEGGVPQCIPLAEVEQPCTSHQDCCSNFCDPQTNTCGVGAEFDCAQYGADLESCMGDRRCIWNEESCVNAIQTCGCDMTAGVCDEGCACDPDCQFNCDVFSTNEAACLADARCAWEELGSFCFNSEPPCACNLDPEICDEGCACDHLCGGGSCTPTGPEICDNALDDDCDTFIDGGDLECQGGQSCGCDDFEPGNCALDPQTEEPCPCDPDCQGPICPAGQYPNAQQQCVFPTSCQDLLDHQPGAPSGAYEVQLQAGVQTVYCEMEMSGGGFTLIARLQGSGPMPPWDFNLQPGFQFGTYAATEAADQNYYLNFAGAQFNEFMFRTIDHQRWLIADKNQVYGEYAGVPRWVNSSSASPTQQANYVWYNRTGVAEDPWISVGNHVGEILYGEAAFSSSPHVDTKNARGGIAVYIR